MLKVDFHSHSLFSNCGLHTIVEMLTRAKELGLKALAITDHGPAQGGRLTSTFFERLHEPVAGIRLLKGMECDLLEKEGEIDFPIQFLRFADIVLLGIHPNTRTGLGISKYTDLLLAALDRNPYVDIITHPDDPHYPVDFVRLATVVRDHGGALELNNSKTLHKRTTPEIMRSMVEACIKTRCPIAVCSDAHSIEEVGRDESVRPFLVDAKFPKELIVNQTEKSALDFVEKRRKVKREYLKNTKYN